MKTQVWILLVLFIPILMQGCKIESEQQSGVIIKDVITDKLENNNYSISFRIKNLNNFTVDCYVRILLDNRRILNNVGIIKAKNEEKKQTTLSLEDEKIQIKIEPVCEKISDLEIQKCGDFKKYSDRRICGLELKNPKLKLCSAKKIRTERLFCMALIANNSKICGYISTSEKYWCAAYITGNISLCERITDSDKKDWCYMDIGMNTRNKGACEKIHDKAKNTSCMAAVFLNADMCLAGDQHSEVACVANIAESVGDKTLCEKLSDSKEECYSFLEE